MPLKQCSECGELGDDARAFCEACGESSIAEIPRPKTSLFDGSGNTEQFDASMIGQVLSDLGLNVSKVRRESDSRVGTTQLVPPEGSGLGVAGAPQLLTAPGVSVSTEQAKKASNIRWFVLAGITIVIILLLLFLVAAVLIFIYWSRFR